MERRDPSPVTPLHVAIVHLGFEPAATAEDLLVRFPLLTEFCTALAGADGVRVTVLARFWRDADLERGGVRYHFRADDPARRLASPLTRPRALYGLLREHRPDVVHVNGLVFPAQVAEMRLRLPADTPLIVQHHGERPYGLRRTWAQRLVRGAIDGYVFSAPGVAEEWRRAGVIAARHAVLSVQETSSHLQPVPPADARQTTGVGGNPAVLWVGRLHPHKAPLLALEAFDRARPALPDPQLFVVYQEAPLLEEMRRFCASRPDLADRVHFVGAVAHARLAEWFSAADLFVTSSPAEGSNVALIESLSCGLLPVCSDIPANRLATGGGEAGVLFPSGDAARAAEALVEAAGRAARGGGQERARLRAHFERRLSWPVVVRQAVAAYRAVIDRRRASGGRGVADRPFV